MTSMQVDEVQASALTGVAEVDPVKAPASDLPPTTAVSTSSSSPTKATAKSHGFAKNNKLIQEGDLVVVYMVRDRQPACTASISR